MSRPRQDPVRKWLRQRKKDRGERVVVDSFDAAYGTGQGEGVLWRAHLCDRQALRAQLGLRGLVWQWNPEEATEVREKNEQETAR